MYYINFLGKNKHCDEVVITRTEERMYTLCLPSSRAFSFRLLAKLFLILYDVITIFLNKRSLTTHFRNCNNSLIIYVFHFIVFFY